jgi:hypothetical protein
MVAVKSTNATLGDCLDSGEAIYIYCDDAIMCGHRGKVDIEKLAAKETPNNNRIVDFWWVRLIDSWAWGFRIRADGRMSMA